MHVVENKSKQGKKIFSSTLLRESYREGGKVKKRTVANISHCSLEEIEAIKFALKNKKRIKELEQAGKIKYKQGQSFGAVYVIHEIAKRIGIADVLGNDRQGKLALWQVIARVIDQGSCLSATRLASKMAAVEVVGFQRKFTEDSLYENLKWVTENQKKIEEKLFKKRRKSKPDLFLYDVTSSYLEGAKNELAAWGYNRDGKKGKKQIVAGLLCDDKGVPVSIEIFPGSTSDTKTFSNQIKKTAKDFGCQRVTFVGDRGMIKSKQIEELQEQEFHYITGITKPQICKLIRTGVFQLELFEINLCEVEYEGERYILRYNPVRAEEMKVVRLEKQKTLNKLIKIKNEYLKIHPRAKIEVALKNVNCKIKQLKANKWLYVEEKEKQIVLQIDKTKLDKEEELDGCYCLKTDLPSTISKDKVHDRYKDLALVEQAFRISKTINLEMRPWYVIKEQSSRGRALIIMLAYMIIQELQTLWGNLNATVEESIDSLATLCTLEIHAKRKAPCYQIPEPNKFNEKLLNEAKIILPSFFPKSNIKIVTRKQLPDCRKSQTE